MGNLIVLCIVIFFGHFISVKYSLSEDTYCPNQYLIFVYMSIVYIYWLYITIEYIECSLTHSRTHALTRHQASRKRLGATAACAKSESISCASSATSHCVYLRSQAKKAAGTNGTRLDRRWKHLEIKWYNYDVTKGSLMLMELMVVAITSVVRATRLCV